MYRTDPTMDQIVLAVSMYLNNFLPAFSRSLQGIRTHYDQVQQDWIVQAQVWMPWGKQVPYGCKFSSMVLVNMPIGEAVNLVSRELLHVILNEDDIKEEVAEGDLPPECLDQLPR